MAVDPDLRERHELCDLFLRLGSSAPTLCAGWDTAHLAAHLAIRERDLRAGPGILIGGPLQRYTDKLMAEEMKRGYENVVERVRTPPHGPLSIPAIRRALSLIEYFVHHEDVRRANALTRRSDRDDLDAALWSALKRMARLMVAKARLGGIRIELVATGNITSSVGLGRAGRTVTIIGRPSELVLYLYGRRDVADVDLSGDAADVARVNATSFGI